MANHNCASCKNGGIIYGVTFEDDIHINKDGSKSVITKSESPGGQYYFCKKYEIIQAFDPNNECTLGGYVPKGAF